ncbi:MAG: DUF3386 family protein [Nitrospira sp.]|uniref:Uncharacterized protein n=1 Tax=Nitrospira defluvii TaxID=330214 RepID=A0ABN7MGA9_9BACT|nr:DUF3386 family protein [Nitrospira defluvii]MCS6327311.1 DUF3386 family protein [Nitrospira sp.]CAE6800998.1 hypothetical protein NSPZN2_80063 [Nitrospira defluvii]
MTPVESKGQTLVDDPAARLLVKDAHSRMYKWPASFAGYRAHVTLNEDGQSVVGMESYVNEYLEVNGIWMPLRRCMSFGENGVVKMRVIELSQHEVW